MVELLRLNQESLFKAKLATTAMTEALKESDSKFAAAYDRHYWELKQGRLGEENALAVRIIEDLKRQLHEAARGQGA
jgi:hypothetical protein